MSRTAARLVGDAAFHALASPTVLLDADLVIRAANRAYLRAVGREEDEILAVNLFEAFPDNPELAGTGRARFVESFERVLRGRRTDHMVVHRYDLLEPGQRRRYDTRYWVPVSSPIYDGDDVVGILHRVDDVTRLRPSALRVLEARRDAMSRAAGRTGASGRDEDDVADSMIIAARDLEAMAEEIDQLREALTSRAVIDQAKGIVMARHGCDADEAFSRLVRMSNDSNVRVVEVARALVYATSGAAARDVCDS
ncbi:ANTAR domain-containing protein [Nocardioides panaciterrulae]|uniref:ANTAR domain-containing protein n=1 Tax=Nocardioides panaciterrulae TaxID=661492 RepID=A0A7Y9E459_9ACTN|nr:ANTAR domain-containing protein [Nocardioides panaciterrulae]NYD40923.1 hypothetical protein [Nocardioides panaciterrulae]